MSSVCRTCLKSNGSFSIFDVRDAIASMIMACASILVQENDGLPRTLCNDCFGNLKISYTFRQLCESSDLQLRKQLSEINSENVTSETDKFKTTSYKFNNIFSTTDIDASSDDLYQIDNNIDVYKEKEVADTQIVECLEYDEILTTETGCNSEVFSIADTEVTTNNSLFAIEKKKVKQKLLVKKKKKIQQVQCQHCGKIFNGNTYLKVHILTHSGEKPLQCSVCAKKFLQKSHLVRHMNSHTGKKPHQCKICGLKISNLQPHMKVHSEIRMFICSVCSRRFKSKSTLKVHIGTHTGIKDHRCDLCNKSFLRRSYLNKHVQFVHFGEKKHKCKVCGKMFANSSNLICHLRIHTGEQPYECKSCAMGFNQPSALKRHMRCHEPKEAKFPKSQLKIDPKMCVNKNKIIVESTVHLQQRKKHSKEKNVDKYYGKELY